MSAGSAGRITSRPALASVACGLGFTLLPDHLDEHPLLPPPVELAIEDLLPRTEVELAVRDRDHDLAPHHLALEVRVGVVLAGFVVAVLVDGSMGREPLEPSV